MNLPDPYAPLIRALTRSGSLRLPSDPKRALADLKARHAEIMSSKQQKGQGAE